MEMQIHCTLGVDALINLNRLDRDELIDSAYAAGTERCLILKGIALFVHNFVDNGYAVSLLSECNEVELWCGESRLILGSPKEVGDGSIPGAEGPSPCPVAP